ncbi:MAG TPA: metallophosphoesterase family protein [Chitinophagaceae bacterium]
MRIALFSDIHANLPALEVMFHSMESEKPDAIYCLGDLVGYNTWPNEVVSEIRRRGIPVIKGNYDQGIGLNIDECGCAYKTEREKEMGKISISYTNSVIGQAEREYLRCLPSHIRVEFRSAENETVTLLLVHGSPRRVNEYLFEDRDEKSLLRIMTDAEADIMCFGHTHKPFHRVLHAGATGTAVYRHAINTGSVGKPKDGDPRGCYVILSLNADIDLSDPGSVQVQFVRFNYDIEKAAAAIKNSPLPDEYAAMLRKGA